MASHKTRNIIGTILIVLIAAVNILTVTLIAQNITAKDTPTVDSLKVSAVEEAEVETLFGTPKEIILYGNGKSITLTASDEMFGKILELNERRHIYVPEFTSAEEFNTDDLNVYYMEYVYAEPHEFTPKGYSHLSVNNITFILTGQHHGKMELNSDGLSMTIGKLSVEVELIVDVVELLK